MGKLAIYVDLHAHASKQGCFMFGNNHQGEALLNAMLLPKLISMNSLNFDFLECDFSDKNMIVKDKKDGLSREGCGRVSIMKMTGLPNCYTLECNYASGRRINVLAPKLNKETGALENETPITDPHSKHYTTCVTKSGEVRRDTAPPYTIEVFEDIGKAFCIGLLDFYNCNPISRLPSSNLRTLVGVKNNLIDHFPIFLPKFIEEEKPTPKIRKRKGQLKSNKTKQAAVKTSSTVTPVQTDTSITRQPKKFVNEPASKVNAFNSLIAEKDKSPKSKARKLVQRKDISNSVRR